MFRDTACGEVTEEKLSSQVTLAGWVHRRRDHGGIIFIDLRDRSGLVQVVYNPQVSPDAYKRVERVRMEWVLQVAGEVARRPPGTENPALKTGAVEVIVRETQVLNPSLTPPFDIGEEVEVEESLRLRYRYLDLRRPAMQANLLLRHRFGSSTISETPIASAASLTNPRWMQPR